MESEAPLIGITTSVEADEQRLDIAYPDAVEKAGGLPVIVPVFKSREKATSFASMLDGLVITGGPAITENMIGDLPPDIHRADARRTQNDVWILEFFVSINRPILGICYGMQLISAHFGGSIYADVQKQLDLSSSHSKTRGASMHSVVLQHKTFLKKLLQSSETDSGQLIVNTRHIQAIAEPGEGLRISAIAPDEVIEGIETRDGRIIGVQFHPEGMGSDGAGLFIHLVDLARTTRDP